MTPLEKSYRLTAFAFIGLVVMLIVMICCSCSTTRAPQSLDGMQVQAYLDCNKARQVTEYTVIVAMDPDSVIYQTYWVDKAVWIKLNRK